MLGAVVPVYNVPGAKELRFSWDVLADIYLGKISNWNDARIAKDNPDAKLPDQKIIVVHRSDGSGTSFIWTDLSEQGEQGLGRADPAKDVAQRGRWAWAARATKA